MSDTISVIERPILFSSPMVNAIRREHNPKTQTRRVITKLYSGAWCYDPDDEPADIKKLVEACPYGQPDHRLWVRETWAADKHGRPFYRADEEHYDVHWRPSIHMPRAASRITLEVVNVRVERLTEISDADAKAEGLKAVTEQNFPQPGLHWQGDGFLNPIRNELHVPAERNAFCYCLCGQALKLTPAQCAFGSLWNCINDKRGYAWHTNPWVWVIEFRMLP